MASLIDYLNVDLDLVSPLDLTPLVEDLSTRGMYPLHTERAEDGRWHSSLEIESDAESPDQTLGVMLAALEAMAPRSKAIWDECEKRDFNIGFDCGDKPWAYQQSLSQGVINRLARLNGSLTITLYPQSRDDA